MSDHPTTSTASVPVVVEEHGADGTLLLRSTMAGGVLHGPLEQFGPGGLPVMLAHFEGGKLHGAVTLYGDDGVMAQRSAFQHGLAHGLIETFIHGRRVSAQTMVEGVACGTSLSFDEAGLPTARLQMAAGQLHGPAVFFHEGRQVRSAIYRSGLLEGEAIDYDAEGQVVQRSAYRANLLHGAVRRYWPGGALMEEQMYRDGVPLGAPTRFNAQGARLDNKAAAPALFERIQRLLRGD